MANQRDLVTATKGTGIATIQDMIKASVKTLGEALPSHMNAERLVRIALTTMRLNPELYKCTPDSFMGALFQSAQLGLEPNVEGQAYIIPFNNNRKKEGGGWHSVKEASFQIGYKGYVELFFRHQNSISLDMQKVYENDDFDFAYGTESFLKHKPAFRDRGEVIGYYAVAKMAHGANVFKFMAVDECMEHGKTHSKCYSKKDGEFYKNTPWASNPDAMCMKTVMIQLMKLLPKSIEIQKALAMDETIKTKVSQDMFGIKDEANWENKEDAEIVEKKPSEDAPQSTNTTEKVPEGGKDHTEKEPTQEEIEKAWNQS